MNYDHQRLAQAQTAQQQWTNNIQTSDAGALIYIPMPSSQYPATAHEPLTSNQHNDYIAQRNQLFANGPLAKKSIIRRTSAAQSIPSSSLQYSSYAHSPATVQVQHNPYQQQQHYTQVANQPTIAQFSNAVDEYLLHGEMPLPQDQTYIVSNAAPSIATTVEPDYLT